MFTRLITQSSRSLAFTVPRLSGAVRMSPMVYQAVSSTSSSRLCSSIYPARYFSSTPGLNNNVDKDLVHFLESEIEAERNQTTIPKDGPGVPGFETKTNGSRVTLTRKVGNEIVTVKFSVNGSVDAEGPSEEQMEQMSNNPNEQMEPPVGDMKSRPEFTVEISKPSGRILGFVCRIYEASEASAEQPEADKFEILEFTGLNADQIDEDGDWDESSYVADGGIIDGQMYDLLMNLLDSRGINNDFVDRLVDFSTYYEHTKYISLLEAIKAFASDK